MELKAAAGVPARNIRALKGHKASVNCLDVSVPSGHQLASGSDDQSLRIWDLRTERASKSIVTCFQSSVESVRFHPYEHQRLFATCGNVLYEFDLRIDGVLIKTPVAMNDEIATKDNEINSLVISPGGDRLAVADDSGIVTILPTNRIKAYQPQRLQKGHSNIINTIAFHPIDTSSFYSGGFDCQLCSWDLGSDKGDNNIPPLAIVNIGQLGKTIGISMAKETINPPFVQCLSYLKNGTGVAVVLGDGSLKIVDAKDPTTLWGVEWEAHNGMATALHCQCRSSGEASDTLIYTGGVDKQIKCWRLTDTSTKSNSANGTGIANDTTGKAAGADDDNDGDDINDDDHHIDEIIASTTITTNSQSQPSGSKKKKKKKKKKKENVDGFDPYIFPMKLELYWQCKHHAKINVIASYYQEEGMVDLNASCPLFVADTTKDITIYYDT